MASTPPQDQPTRPEPGRFVRPPNRPVPLGAVPASAPVRRAGPPAAARPPRRGYDIVNFLQGLIAILLIAAIGFGGTFTIRYAAEMQLVLDATGLDDSVSSVARSALSTIDEQPAFASVSGAPELPLCATVESADARDLADAMNLMRRTSEGSRLFDQLLFQGICVGVEDLAYNSGYAQTRQVSPGDWSQSFIMVDRDMIDSGETDVLAALLIHEATHIDRFVNGLACSYSGTCVTLANGVALYEEVAAHAAEAQWWQEAYGDDGKRFTLGYGYGLNQLLKAYLAGGDDFLAFVSQLRSDEREGDFHRGSV